MRYKILTMCRTAYENSSVFQVLKLMPKVENTQQARIRVLNFSGARPPFKRYIIYSLAVNTFYGWFHNFYGVILVDVSWLLIGQQCLRDLAASCSCFSLHINLTKCFYLELRKPLKNSKKNSWVPYLGLILNK